MNDAIIQLRTALEDEIELCFCEAPHECRRCVRLRAVLAVPDAEPISVEAESGAAAMRESLEELIRVRETKLGPIERIKYGSDGRYERAKAALASDAGKGWTSPKKRAELNALYQERCTDLEKWEAEAEELMKQMGKDAVRVCEGGAAENIRASLAVSVSKLLSDRRHLASRLTECVKYQPHSPDCHTHGRELPADRFSLVGDDLYPSRGPPGPCDCWRSRFFKALGVTT